MASTSAPRPSLSSAASRIASAASNLSSDNQTLIAVKELENTVLELLESYDDCTNLSEAINNVGNNYQPSAQPTDFRKLLEDEIATLKAESSFVPQKSPLYRQFKEAIWNVHHEGQPMPGEEQEDIVMTSTQNVLLNMTCPLTGKPIVELQNPVRCVDCKHIYEKDPIMHYIRTKPQALCPVAGCPKSLREGRVICDPLLRIEIDEIRAASRSNAVTNVEDYTEINDDLD
ncbi:E3 SUMO-protein ligase MMS21 isoform X2 [Phalaenopsis equestris]|uniref:E3 SUMO-protein ligase MMS21 isoform X2 n=1 Tax=Phalaenopsis equestris TaxID=78828 RepID=UPI0009E63842|nr:E3 SUMO-protein ligase MMS21 isoform X2 [Phalaenopsis equestris]